MLCHFLHGPQGQDLDLTQLSRRCFARTGGQVSYQLARCGARMRPTHRACDLRQKRVLCCQHARSSFPFPSCRFAQIMAETDPTELRPVFSSDGVTYVYTQVRRVEARKSLFRVVLSACASTSAFHALQNTLCSTRISISSR